MRLFVAADLDDALRARAAAAIQALQDSLRSGGASGRAGWVAPDKLHLTLLFIGEVPDTVAETIRERLSAPFDVPPFELGFGGVGVFPPSGRARVGWLAVTAGGERLSEVRRQLDSRLEGVPFPRDDRPFSPHLTLVRFREPLRPAERTALLGAAVHPVGACRIDHVTLYRSHLSPRGATYTPEAITPLAPRSDAR